jgi:hypothetical protein
MTDVHALSGAYAVDALDDIERAQFARHLEQCTECQAEVAGLREAAAMLSETTAVEPPAGMRDRVLADIRSVRPLPPVAPPITGQVTGPDTGPSGTPAPDAAPVVPLAARRRRLRVLVAAAAAVVLLGTGGTVAVRSLSDDRDDQTPVARPATDVERVQRAADAVRRTQTLPNGGEATVIASRKLDKIVVMTKDLPPLSEDEIYEMWIDDADRGMVKAGLMTADDATVVLDGDLQNAVGAGITVEPAGGSTVPTDEPIALFSFENT